MYSLKEINRLNICDIEPVCSDRLNQEEELKAIENLIRSRLAHHRKFVFSKK